MSISSSQTKWYSVGHVLRVLFWPFFAAAILAICLQSGLWTHEETHTGPFAPDSLAAAGEAGVSVGFQVREDIPLQCCLSVRTNNMQNPNQSDLRLWINGKELEAVFSANYGEVRKGRQPGFTVWNHLVVFGLPVGLPNDATTNARVRYSLAPPRGSVEFLSFISVLLALVAFPGVVNSGRRVATSVLIVESVAVRVAGALCVAAAIVYLFSILYAWTLGWALPTTAIIRWSSTAEWLTIHEPYLGHLLLIVATAGIFAKSIEQKDGAPSRAVTAPLAWWVWPVSTLVIFCLLLLSLSGMWSGIVRSEDFQYANLGGLIPYSDSVNHVAAAFDQAKDGVWSSFALRRPFAAAFRSVLLFLSGNSIPLMQVMQIAILSGSICFAIWSIMRWSGFWAGIIFFALSYTYARVFAPLTLTEILGLIWAFAAVPFVVETLRTKSTTAGLVAFALLVVALMTRMGSMVTIPVFLLWLILQFGGSIRQKLWIVAAGFGIIIGVFLVSTLLQRFYGTVQADAGSNFPFVVCGLTLGTTWDGCLKKLIESGSVPKTEVELSQVLYAMAWENFLSSPVVLINRVIDGMAYSIFDTPDLLFKGYFGAGEPRWFPRSVLLILALSAAIIYLIKSTIKIEIWFWSALLLSVVASSGIVYFDDGRRSLAATYPLLFLMIARVVSAPAWKLNPQVVRHDRRMTRWSGLILGVGAAALLVTPWLAHAARSSVYDAAASTKSASSEAIVLGGSGISGFLVVSDGAPLLSDVPSVHLSVFRKMVGAANIELQQGLINPVTPPLPFAFVFAARAESDAISGSLYIVPAEVIQRRDVKAWKLSYRSWQPKPPNGELWFYVTRADPIS